MPKIEEKIVFFFAGNIERGANYHWVRGYSVKTEFGAQYPWMTKKECWAYARAEKKKSVFIETSDPDLVARISSIRRGIKDTTMKHYWVYQGKEQCEECAYCGLRRRQRTIDSGKYVNSIRPRYKITEYLLPKLGWTWVKRRKPIPKCEGKGP